MFGIDFYPTPMDVAKKMVDPYVDPKRGAKQFGMILEPSAGSGNLIKALEEVYKEKIKAFNKEKEEKLTTEDKNWRDYRWIFEDEAKEIKNHVHVCEIDPNLQSILRDNGYRIVDDDFLSYDTGIKYNLILMNPPFSNGAKHVLRAIEMLSPGGKLCALLNAHSLMNNQSESYKALRGMIKLHGSAVGIGRPFKDAQRETDVEIALIRYQDPRQPTDDLFNMEGFEYETLDGITEEEVIERSVATRDVIGTLLRQYKAAQEYYMEFRKASRHMHSLLNLFDFDYQDEEIKNMNNVSRREGERDADQYNNFLLKLNKAAWKTVFRLTGMKKRMTERMRQQFEKHENDTSLMAFTRKNINAAIQLLLENNERIMLQCILDCYDELTRYSKDNLEPDKRFKTNNAYRVKKKVIIPYCVEWSPHWGFSIKYNVRDGIISDLDKAMCFLAGLRIEDISTIPNAMEIRKDQIKKRGRDTEKGMIDTTVDSTFFELKFFKKGTLHIKFKDEKLWEFFNQTVARERGWLQDYEPGAKGDEVIVSQQTMFT